MGKGCFSKVRASDIVSDAEERQDPVLRACVALERDARPSSKSRSPRATPQYANLPSQVAQRSTHAAPAAAHVVKQPKGRIVRDDFSDDSDERHIQFKYTQISKSVFPSKSNYTIFSFL